MADDDVQGARRDRLAIAAALLLAALALFVYGERSFATSTAGPSRDDFHFGEIDVLTDDPEATTALQIRFSADYSDYIEDEPISLELMFETHRDEVAFLVVLGGDAARTGIEPRSLSVLPVGERRGAGDLWVQGDAVEAWYVNAAGPLFGGAEPPPVAAVVVGRARRSAPAAPLEVSMVIPTDGRFAEPTSTGVGLVLPRLGHARGRWDDVGIGMRSDEPPASAAASRLVRDVLWTAPAALQTEVELFDLRQTDRLIEPVPPPTTEGDAFRRVWRKEAPLEVSAFVEDQSLVRAAHRRQFMAGATVGLSGALLVWAIEIALGIALDVRRERSRSRRRLKADS